MGGGDGVVEDPGVETAGVRKSAGEGYEEGG